ncbi:MAG: hypothetical protein GWN29_03240 [Gammaproteobacteria bacterium]|nr:hypothetical protein [Gammaproteobacteria bacterium]
MSIYQVQKLIQSVNRDPQARERFFENKDEFVEEFGLTDEEGLAVSKLDMYALYEMGVHPLLLRPFTIIHGVSEPDYLHAIRKGDD